MQTENTITKKCNTCQEEKELDSFNKDKLYCRDCQRKKRREYNLTERAIKLDMIKHARDRAIKNNLDFNITVEDIPPLPKYCPVFQWIKLERALYKANDNSYTLDRINNNRGYVKDNIKVISNRANSCKRDMTYGELQALLEYMKES